MNGYYIFFSRAQWEFWHTSSPPVQVDPPPSHLSPRGPLWEAAWEM